MDKWSATWCFLILLSLIYTFVQWTLTSAYFMSGLCLALRSQQWKPYSLSTRDCHLCVETNKIANSCRGMKQVLWQGGNGVLWGYSLTQTGVRESHKKTVAFESNLAEYKQTTKWKSSEAWNSLLVAISKLQLKRDYKEGLERVVRNRLALKRITRTHNEILFVHLLMHHFHLTY